MKKNFGFTVVFFLCYFISSAQNSINSSLSNFEWLLGKWERINNKEGRIAYESWAKESDTKFIGYGWTMKRKDTAFFEKFSLVIKDNAVYYVADVSENPAPVWFRITEQSKNSFTSSNPEHDFPKKIEYKLTEGNIITAVISGDGKEIQYKFKKMQ